MRYLGDTAEIDTSWPKGERRVGWLGSHLDKAALTWMLNAEEVAALRELVAQTADKPMTQIRRGDFSHPLVNGSLANLVREVKRGAGVAFVRGLPVSAMTADERRRVFWGLGAHFGEALSQSRAGDMMGDVTPRQGTQRGYTSDKELELHTDSAEIASLLCLQSAKSGGENVMVNSLALWNIVEQERPDLVPVLKTGFRLWRINEHSAGTEPITPYHVPIFGEKDGLRSVWQGWQVADATAEYLGEPLSDTQKEAIAFILDVLKRPELHLTVRLDEGEAMFWSNYEILHSRRAFVQWEDPAKTRHLLRLWMQAAPSRPLPDEMIVWRNASGRQGHDPEPQPNEAGFTLRGQDPVSKFMIEYFKEFYRTEPEKVSV